MINTITHTEMETLLLSLPNQARLYRDGDLFWAGCYEPNDILNGARCYGSGSTLVQAIATMLLKVEEAKLAGPILKTAKEVKAAVVALIEDHKAQPTAFRQAVDDLRVADR